ncbi:hypothetical protein [Myroides pelagicus]|uniref:Uncharacterized protein n=1 Tax=Myroides pelagicus TaxID=270914 RepID=A0A7K1GP81_9FLAO|nr:hypothetical protein [Myroides pelagicus]MTH30369.1 hypothetical protein [Myroides pelagicus]
MDEIRVKCQGCGDEVEVKIPKEPIAEHKQDGVSYAILEQLVENDSDTLAIRSVTQFIKLECLALILYLTANQQWEWWWIFALCVVSFILLSSRRLRFVFVLGIAIASAYIVLEHLLVDNTYRWIYAIGIFLVLLLIHGIAFFREKRSVEIMGK